ncbi:YvcK family protein [Iamia majanohamensis]|uniref:YvcK family protein n=1 Tax=Iamia majanohamensis TaxID=467976 RepID=A0AAE9YDC5_9ACTN|nr:gluconeogenesis factor YvcK family protein [Iamia majanohamensis]WCO69088.1 YvcK family protein [Iamia majanohamensis]
MSSVACVGGGHGLAATLRAVRPWADDVTAIVSVADDGGSSGRLRDDLGLLPPGDLRRCLSALADPTSPLGAALEHRFDGGELKGHPLGNLLIAGLVDHGLSVEDALGEVGRLVGAEGRVLPAATVPVTLSGERGSLPSVQGQVRVQGASGLHRVAVTPADAPTPGAVGRALAAADLVVLGPGSLFTSVLAAAVVPGVAEPLRATDATRVLVLNLGAQVGETEGLAPADHVRLALAHDVPVDVVLADPRFAPDATPEGVALVVAEVGSDRVPVHDPDRLGAALRDLVGR